MKYVTPTDECWSSAATHHRMVQCPSVITTYSPPERRYLPAYLRFCTFFILEKLPSQSNIRVQQHYLASSGTHTMRVYA